MMRRLPPQPGEWIDRSRPIDFRFEGAAYQGFAGDVLSSALWANDVRCTGRSFKYHRPRGIYSLANDDVNAMVEDGQSTNLRGDVLALRPDLDIRAVNTVGGVAGDWLRFTEWFSAFMPVGFYYKAFHTPRFLFPFFERQIRQIAGLGTIKPLREAPRTPKDYAFCDLLVVGAGPAGLAGAIAAAEQGVKVVVVEEQARPGGSLAWQWAAMSRGRTLLDELLRRVGQLDNIEMRCGTEAGGYYADHWIALFDQRRLTKLRARALLVAAGCFEQPAVFNNNDLPGVMLGSAAQRLIHVYAVKPFDRSVVLAANAEGYRLALDLRAAGVAVAALVDLRPGGDSGDLTRQLEAADVPVLRGHTIYEALPGAGKRCIRAALVCPLDGQGQPRADATRRFECDGIAMSVGWAPAAGLLYQAGGRFAYSAGVEQFVPQVLPSGVFAAGRVNGAFDLEAQLLDGRRAGLAAAAHLGRYDGVLPVVPQHQGPPPSHPYPIFAHPRKKNFVDLDEDLHFKDFVNAHQEGYDNIELLKRYTTVGMGPSQGKLANMNAIRILARLNGKSIEETGTTTARPFHNPVTMGQLAGRRFHALRRTPMHDWHVQQGADMTHAGAWLRPDFYPRAGKTRDDCILEEALAVRQRLGMIDVSTLGKIEVRGPDAAAFLERVYTSTFARMQVGKTRYALACDESGVLIEDGVVGRLGEDRFYVTSTSSGSGVWFRELQRWAIIWGSDVALTALTGQLAAFNLAGPLSREALAPLTDVDLSAAAFPFLGIREGKVLGVPALLMRVGFVGELGYEIHVPASYAMHVWTALMERCRPVGIRPFGVEAQRLLRLEKGFLLLTQDTDALTHPFETNLERTIGKDKGFFVGQRSLEILRRQPLTRRLVGFTLPDTFQAPWPEECHLIFENGEIAGRVTSIARRTTLGRPIGLAFVRPHLAAPGTKVQVRVGDGSYVTAEVAPTPFYDPENARQQLGSAGQTATPPLRQREESGPLGSRPSDATTTSGPVRRSPVHHFLEEHGARWNQRGGARFAVRLDEVQAEEQAARDLALCDLSGLAKLGVRGLQAAAWLRGQGLDVPSELYDTRGLPDGGLITRVGRNEFLLEGGIGGETIRVVAESLGAGTVDAYPVVRQEATFLLVGRRVRDVLAQTCALDFGELPPRRLVYTRIAGVSSAILPSDLGGIPAYRLWVDPSYAADLWQSLATIVQELNGCVVGSAWLYSELSDSPS
jgi:sarcosine oxidase subunit alpha